MISVYVPQDNFYDSFINFDTTLRKKEIVVITGDFNGQVGRNAEDYKDRHGSEE